MAVKPVWSVVRELLSANLALTADEVITKAKAKGVEAPDDVIRTTAHNVRKKLKQKGVQAPKVAPAAARETTAPTPSNAAPAPTPTPPTGVAGVLSNVALVNAAVTASGGVEQARQVAEAVRACGGPEQFAQYLDLVAGIRTVGVGR
jgi:hypothetical protein